MTSLKLPAIIGHRGACGYAPENTLASFAKAKELGASWVEMDVRLTQDNALIIFHDDNLERTTNGAGWVHETTLATIALLDAGSWYSPHYTHERVPTLEAALTSCVELGLGVNLELKAWTGQEEVLSKNTLALLQAYPTLPILLSSFSFSVLQCLRQMATALPIAWNLEAWSPNVLEMAHNMQCYSVHLPAEKIAPERIQALHQQGQRVLAFTVNEVSLAEQLFEIGIDAIFTDIPDINLSIKK